MSGWMERIKKLIQNSEMVNMKQLMIRNKNRMDKGKIKKFHLI